jgi:hypothetical protein
LERPRKLRLHPKPSIWRFAADSIRGAAQPAIERSKKLAWAYALAAKAPGSVSFDDDEIRRINDAELILWAKVSIRDLGYGEMSWQLEYDLLEFFVAHEAIKRGKMPYQQ